ncbi:hypothetical protein FACS1894156_6980 [Bacteroidia bacterium]|nr:hypothetical protein FACS1894156_6980 [Bacteroidia bacterium]
MGDNFWKLLLSLSDFDGFAYSEYESVSDNTKREFPELFITNKSMIYRIIRKYIFSFTERDKNYQSFIRC